ncbi:response regulator [Terriglobus aquaticus]|uniref:Response regulator n=1 Tax=Terriglobus aquaticus TaxID=940139 RepID=A0ABW9KF85_9BACT|nr:response regulator [Terriglobus aquaticus]
MKRRILLVDDEVAVLLTLKTVLEISGFDVDTATSAREGKSRIKHREYEMVITDMRMEGERAGEEVIEAAKAAPYQPAIALLTAFPVDDEALDSMGADQMLVKPMHTRQLLQQLEALFAKRHGTADASESSEGDETEKPAKKVAATKAVKSAAAKPKPAAAKKTTAKKAPASKKAVAK